MAQLGMRVSHKKISVATTREGSAGAAGSAERRSGEVAKPEPLPVTVEMKNRRLYFEDIEVRRSRSKGVACRVTLRKGDASFVGEAEGVESERIRVELAARAALQAIMDAEGKRGGVLGLEGCKVISAFEREFVFVGVTARLDREAALLTGSAEVRESPETASVLAVLDATNRWVEYREV
jgi:hypothetical protein